MNTKIILLGTLVLTVIAQSAAHATELMPHDTTKTVSYISGVTLKNEVMSIERRTLTLGTKIVKRDDGSCYRESTSLHRMDDLKTLHGVTIQSPETTTEIQPVDCSVANTAK